MVIDTIITTYNTAVTDAAKQILGKEHRSKKPWVTKDDLDLCDEKFEEEAVRSRRSRRIQGSTQEDSEGSEESKGGLDSCSVIGG